MSIVGLKKWEVKGDDFVLDVEVEGSIYADVLPIDCLASEWEVIST